MFVGLGKIGPVGAGKQYGSHDSMHSSERSHEWRWYSSGAKSLVHSSEFSLRKGQWETRANMEEIAEFGGGVAVAVIISSGSVGKIQVVVIFIELIMVFGTVPQLWVGSGVEIVVMVGFGVP